MKTEELQLVKDAADALWGCAAAGLTVQPTLDKPYDDDDPRWTPWTRWMGPACQRAHDVALRARAVIRAEDPDWRTRRGSAEVLAFSSMERLKEENDLLRQFAQTVIDLDSCYSGTDAVVRDLARRAAEALGHPTG